MHLTIPLRLLAYIPRSTCLRLFSPSYVLQFRGKMLSGSCKDVNLCPSRCGSEKGSTRLKMTVLKQFPNVVEEFQVLPRLIPSIISETFRLTPDSSTTLPVTIISAPAEAAANACSLDLMPPPTIRGTST